jgi:hypothetical protein
MRHFDLRLCSALCAALLLGGAAAWPAAALASTGAGPSATLDQLTGITGAPCPTSGFWGWRPVGCGQPLNAGYPYSFAGTNYGHGYSATPYSGLSGYSSAYSGFGGLALLGNNYYPGSGLAAWSSSSYRSASPGAYTSYGSAPYGANGSIAYAANGYGGYAIPTTAAPPGYLLCTSLQDNQPVLVGNGTSTAGYTNCAPFIQ